MVLEIQSTTPYLTHSMKRNISTPTARSTITATKPTCKTAGSVIRMSHYLILIPTVKTSRVFGTTGLGLWFLTTQVSSRLPHSMIQILILPKSTVSALTQSNMSKRASGPVTTKPLVCTASARSLTATPIIHVLTRR